MNEEEKRLRSGECKWSKNRVGKKLLKEMEEKSKKARWKNEKRKEKFVLFFKSGFTKGLKKAAKKRKGVELCDLDTIGESLLK